jgi:predicted DNA-binding transcriptional regulator YafY
MVGRMRADRLVAIVLLLQARGQLTAGELAEELEASERTIRRDLDSLSAAGVPVYSQRGRGGGWALLGGHRLNLSGLTADEAQALFMVAGPGGLTDLGIEPGVRSALRKLLAALPAPMREQAAAARQAVHVDPTAWGREQTDPAPGPPFLDALRRAVVDAVQVDIDYAKPGEARRVRRVHPFGLVAKRGTWYLMAGTGAGPRTFRVSRVYGVEVTEEPVERPDGFDLETAWARTTDGFSDRLHTVAVELRVEPWIVDRVRAGLTGWTSFEEPEAVPGGRHRLRVMFPTEGSAAGELARYGSGVEVVDPPSVRDRLAKIGQELVDTYL